MSDILFIHPKHTRCQEFDDAIGALGHTSWYVSSVDEAQHRADSASIDVAFLDASVSDVNILEALQRLRSSSSNPEIVVISSSMSPEEAEATIRGGAWDYVQKPSSAHEYSLILSRVLQYRRQRPSAGKKIKKILFEGIVGSSPAMKACLELVSQAAESDANVLIVGETGTGKELIASAIHANSLRAKKNFVVVDCAAIPENLVESTLLGHERGAFTGAERSHVGLIKQADGGTLFLDEVSELPLPIQKSFLRVLQERRFRPVGGTTEVESDFRIIAASNRNLGEMVESGEFRKDLLFRIRAFSIELTPLRERTEDISELIRYHIPAICSRMDIEVKQIADDFFEVSSRYAWPGNVRELVNALERSVAAARYEPMIYPTHLPTYIRVHLAQSVASDSSEKSGSETRPEPLPPLSEVRAVAVNDAEKRYLEQLMQLTGADVNEACRISGLSRSRIYALLKKHDIPSSL